MPHPRRGFERLLEAHGGQLVEGLAVVGVGRERQRAGARLRRRRAFKLASRSAAARCADGRAASRRSCRGRQSPKKQAKRSSSSRSPGSVWVCSSATICSRCSSMRRNRVGGGKLARATSPIHSPSASYVEHRQRLAAAQLRMAAAGDQLLGLHEELDLADAAAPELDVVTLDRDLAMAAIGVDWRFMLVDVGDRGEVEIFAPDDDRCRQSASRC